MPWEKVVELLAVNWLIAPRSELPYGNWGAGMGWMVNFNSAGCRDDHYAKYNNIHQHRNLVPHRRVI